MHKLDVNWLEVSELGRRTLNNCEEYETARNNYQRIINELYDCWDGSDADTFIIVANDFLEYLKGNTRQLDALSKAFNASSKFYGSTVEEHTEKYKRINDLLEEEYGKKKPDLENGGY